MKTQSLLPLFLLTFSLFHSTLSDDTPIMLLLQKNLQGLPNSWNGAIFCNWEHVACDSTGRVVKIQLKDLSLTGQLPPNLNKIDQLQDLELQGNQLTGPLPTLSGLNQLQTLILAGNSFSSIPPDFFTGLSSLQYVDIDEIPFSPWNIPHSFKDAITIQTFSANSANIIGTVPDFFGDFPGLVSLHLAFNMLEGGLPSSFTGLEIQSLWLNGQNSSSKLNGRIDVLQNMTMLSEVWLHSNSFTGPLPDFSGLKNLKDLSLRDNQFTGVVPQSLVTLGSLVKVNLTNNLLQGPTPVFGKTVAVDMSPKTNSFCLDIPGECDSRINVMLSFAKEVGYPIKFAQNWKGNDPCSGVGWPGISCDGSDITVINFPKMNLTGTISPDLALLKSLKRLILANNSFYGSVPKEFTTLPNIERIDVSNNQLSGDIPSFKGNGVLVYTGNPKMGSPPSGPSLPGSHGSPPPQNPEKNGNGNKVSSGVIVGSVLGAIFALLLIGLGGLCIYKRKKRFSRVQSPNAMVVHPRYSGSDPDIVKITVAGSNLNANAASETYSHTSSGAGDIQIAEAGNMVISIQVLRNVTNNFSEENILGRGGFGTVYKGELHDGTKIAVKRMESGVMSGKGLTEFKSEIAVLTKVRHRHLVALLGYCLDGNERLLVYEYMPQGTLSDHLFNRKDRGIKPLEWTRRLTIALDVARGVEYLHGLAHQSFIHRDLKPSNILLGDDMRAKVADFGLVRLAPDGKASIETRLAGTFGYLAPEYAVTGRVTTKVDVYSFGVILMELITGRKALDERENEDSMHLVSWFRRMHINKDTFSKAIDPTMELTEETLASVSTVAELAGHCSAREPYQRPDMGHAVNVLSSLVELWKPTEADSEDIYGVGIDLDMTLPQALKKWQAFEGTSRMDGDSSSFLASVDNTQTSIPTRPTGFADSFTSADGR